MFKATAKRKKIDHLSMKNRPVGLLISAKKGYVLVSELEDNGIGVSIQSEKQPIVIWSERQGAKQVSLSDPTTVVHVKCKSDDTQVGIPEDGCCDFCRVNRILEAHGYSAADAATVFFDAAIRGEGIESAKAKLIAQFDKIAVQQVEK